MKILQKRQLSFSSYRKKNKGFPCSDTLFYKNCAFFELENSHFSQMAGYYDLLKKCVLIIAFTTERRFILLLFGRNVFDYRNFGYDGGINRARSAF